MLLGAPGSGKGTQAARFASDYDVPVIATGDILRKNIKENTPLGQQAQSYIEKGDLVPDDLVIALVDSAFAEADAKGGWLLDGFPRTTAQAEALDVLLEKTGKKLDRVFLINVPKDVLISRITGRLLCPKCGRIYHEKSMPPSEAGVCDLDGAALTRRVDDNAETAESRIAVYNEQTKPLIDYYAAKGLLTEIDGTIGLDKIEDVIRETLS
ncbi:MAG: adenylate kinase [Clostridiales Family XIII bacterium]|jgi:adenylate kinase|nr:adenylate kinase [Clostridiales Family XIII bacterium]